MAMGLPTMSDRPTTTARRPLMSMPSRREQLHDAGRGARHQLRSSLLQSAHVDGVETVDILGGIDTIENGRTVDGLGQRQLHENAVDLVIGVEPIDEGFELALRSGGGEHVGLGPHPELRRGLGLGSDIDLGCRIIADEHHIQAEG